MRYVIIHYCTQIECDCADRNGVIAYDGFDAAESQHWLANAPSGYVASDESARYTSTGPTVADPVDRRVD